MVDINVALNLIENLKNSQEKKDRDIFECMILTLLDEFKQHSSYSEKDLDKTWLIFEMLINKKFFFLIILINYFIYYKNNKNSLI